MQSEKVIWITGGGSGIGRALALHWAELGHQVVISGRRIEKLEETAALAPNAPHPIQALVCDVSDEHAATASAARVVEICGRMDVCVANAGFGVVGKFENITPEEWRRQIDVNLFGAIWTMQAALKHLRASTGRLAVVSSVSGKLAVAKTSAYSASKFALVGICNSLYQELHGSGVSITNILPGLVDTDIALVDNNGVYKEHRIDKRPKNLMWSSERAAKEIAKAIEARKREAVITGHGKLAVFLANHLASPTYWFLSRQGESEYI